MEPLSEPDSPLSVTVTHTGLQISDHTPSDAEASTAGLDRKAKKRMQNRVAQRTYRTRIKQRLHDLQQQVHTLQQKEGEQQGDPQLRETEGNDGDDENLSYYPAFSGNMMPSPARVHSVQQSNVGTTCPDVPGMKMVDSSSWTGIPSQSTMWTSSFRQGHPVCENSFQMPMRLAPELAPGDPRRAMMPNLPPTSLPLSLSTGPFYSHMGHEEDMRSTLAFSPGADGNPQQHSLSPTGGVFIKGEEGQTSRLENPNSPRLYARSLNVELRATSGDSNSVSTVRQTSSMLQSGRYQGGVHSASLPTASAQWENGVPNPQGTPEERFEYVLSCAQRVGFEDFDAMALHYYTRNFHPASALALEQRLSRNRRLPELLAELRKQSATWSVGQRRGFQDETLKAAEEICTVECDELRASAATGGDTETVNETALEDMLPNLCTLLTGLVSSNPQLSQRQVSELVFTSMRLLCGLEGPRNQPMTSSRQSPR